jgi:hypothetical protein
MRIFLVVQSGPRTGQRTRLNPGQSLRVGRTTKSDLAFAEDPLMSSIHFELECGENACRFRDLNSLNGTSLNGQRVKQSNLMDGDKIVAGGTTFLLQMEGVPSPVMEVPPPLPPLPADATPHDRLLYIFRHNFQPLYAILDAARDIKIYALLLNCKDEHQSLYEGQQGAKLAQVAPYVVRLKQDSLLLDTLIREGWGQSWGIYLTCPLELQEVRKHFRHFLEVQLPDGKQVYFRFYDPRVLRVFLPTCAPEEANQIFGPVQYYVVEDEKPQNLIRFVNTAKGIEEIIGPLVDQGEPNSEPHAGTAPRLERPLVDGVK